MTKISMLLAASLLSVACAQAFPSPDESFQMWISSKRSINEAIIFYTNFREENCTPVQVKLFEATIAQMTYNSNLVKYFDGSSTDKRSAKEVNDYSAHTRHKGALEAISNAIAIKCKNGDKNISDLYYQISNLYSDSSFLYYEKR